MVIVLLFRLCIVMFPHQKTTQHACTSMHQLRLIFPAQQDVQQLLTLPPLCLFFLPQQQQRVPTAKSHVQRFLCRMHHRPPHPGLTLGFLLYTCLRLTVPTMQVPPVNTAAPVVQAPSLLIFPSLRFRRATPPLPPSCVDTSTQARRHRLGQRVGQCFVQQEPFQLFVRRRGLREIVRSFQHGVFRRQLKRFVVPENISKRRREISMGKIRCLNMTIQQSMQQSM